MLYERISVIINGVELTARPIEFVNDPEGMPMEAIRWETTCPDTGQMIQFSKWEVKWEGDTAIYGNQVVKREVDKTDQIKRAIEREVPIIKEECPFVDPIETGLFTI